MDVTLSAGGAQLGAHAFVLAMRSPVFKAMLDNDMREAKSRVIDLRVDEEVQQKDCFNVGTLGEILDGKRAA